MRLHLLVGWGLAILLGSGFLSAQEHQLALRAELRTKPVVADVAGGTTIRVVSGRTGKPLAGADVLLMMPTDWSEEIERERQAAYRDTKDQWFVSRFQTLLRFGRRWRTDANGQVTLPSEPWMWGIVHEDLWAHGHHFREPRIELLPRLRLAVHVLAADGKPAAGVPLQLEHSHGPLNSAGATTDAGGRAEVEVDSPDLFYDELKLAVALPIEGCPVAKFVPRERALAGGAAIELQLPSLARAVLTAVRADGSRRPFRTADLRRTEDEATGRNYYLANVDASGEAVVWARPGQRLIAYLTFDDQIGWSKIQVQMPTEVGGIVRIPVAEPQASVAFMRVLDREGKPFAGQPVCLYYGGFGNTRTDTKGRLHIVVGQGFSGPGAVLVGGRVADRAAAGGFADTTVGAVVLDLPAAAERPVDLGTVQLAEEPILLAGQVVDTAGVPVPHARIVRAALPRQNGDPLFDGPRATGDAEGRFVLRGLLPGIDQIGVSARDVDGTRYGEELFAVGNRKVQLVVK